MSQNVLRPVATLFLTLLGGSAALAQCQPAVQQLLTDQRFDEARTQMTAVVDRDAGDHVAMECLGRVLFRMGRIRDAAARFENAIKSDGRVASHHLWLGNALGTLADSTSKIRLPFLARRIKAAFEKTVALDPTSIEGREGLVEYYLQAPAVAGGSREKALEQIREITRLNPMRGHFKAAGMYAVEKKTAEAERALLAAQQVAPDSALAGYTLGSFYQNAERWTEAFAVYDRMLNRFPGEALVHFNIGRAAALSGQQLERGERELRQFIAAPPADLAKPTLAGAHHRLGMVYEKQGRKDAARAEYQAALRIDPKTDNAKKSLAALK